VASWESASGVTLLTGSTNESVPSGETFTNVDIYTAGGDGPQIVPQVQKKVYVMNGDPAAFTAFLSRLGNFTAVGTSYSWKEHRLVPEITTISGSVAGTETQLTVAHGSIVPTNAVLFFPAANAHFAVTSRSGNTLTGFWLQEPSGGIANGATAVVIHVGIPDGARGSTMPVAAMTTRTNYYVDVDIRQQFSDKLLATQFLAPSGSYVEHLNRLLSAEFLKMQEKALLFGVSGTASGDNGVFYWSDGLLQYAVEDGEVAVGGALTQTVFENNLEEKLFNRNSGPANWVAFMAGSVRRVISNWYKDDVRYQPGKGREAGLSVDTLTHPCGETIKLVTHKLLSLLGLTDIIFVVNMTPDNLKLIRNKCCAGPVKRLFKNLNGSNSLEVSIRNVFTLMCQGASINTMVFRQIEV